MNNKIQGNFTLNSCSANYSWSLDIYINKDLTLELSENVGLDLEGLGWGDSFMGNEIPNHFLSAKHKLNSEAQTIASQANIF